MNSLRISLESAQKRVAALSQKVDKTESEIVELAKLQTHIRDGESQLARLQETQAMGRGRGKIVRGLLGSAPTAGSTQLTSSTSNEKKAGRGSEVSSTAPISKSDISAPSINADVAEVLEVLTSMSSGFSLLSPIFN